MSFSGSDPTPRLALARWLDLAAMAMAMGIVAARVAMLETLRDPFAVSPNAPSIPQGPGAGTAAILDLLCFLPAILAAASAVLRERAGRMVATRGVGGEFIAWVLPATLLAVWIGCSVVWAQDRFLAAAGASTWIAATLIAWTLARTANSPRKLRLCGGLCAGLLLAMIGQGVIYRFVELPTTQDQFLQNRTELLSAQGLEPGSFAAKRFEQKLMAGEMLGYSASPNTFAAILVWTGIVTAGLLLQRQSDRDEPAWTAVLVAILLASAFVGYHTFSRAASGTPVVAAAGFAAWKLVPLGIATSRRKLLIAGLVAAVIAAATVVGIGVWRNGLPSRSLDFRWRYWTGATAILAAHPLGGVGWNNFPAAYLRHRLPSAAEEIRDPHNLFARFAAETGVIGLSLAVWTLLAIAATITRPGHPAASLSREPDPDAHVAEPTSADRHALPSVRRGRPVEDAQPRMALLALPFAVAGIAVVVNALASVDPRQDGVLLGFELLKRSLLGLLLVGGMLLGTVRSLENPSPDSRPAPWVRVAFVLSLLAVLLHNLIDFSLFETGGLFAAAMLLGVATAATRRGVDQIDPNPSSSEADARHAASPTDPLGHAPDGGFMAASARSGRDADGFAAGPFGSRGSSGIGRSWHRWLPIGALGVLGIAAAAIGLLYALPVARAESITRSADDLLRESRPQAAAGLYAQAAGLVPFNADYVDRTARAMAFARGDPRIIASLMARALQVDPSSQRRWNTRAEFRRQLTPPDLAGAADDYARAIELNPDDVNTRLNLAAVLETLARPADAANAYEAALAADDALDADETERMPAEQRTELDAKIRQLRSPAATPAAAAPNTPAPAGTPRANPTPPPPPAP